MYLVCGRGLVAWAAEWLLYAGVSQLMAGLTSGLHAAAAAATALAAPLRHQHCFKLVCSRPVLQLLHVMDQPDSAEQQMIAGRSMTAVIWGMAHP